MGEPRSSKEQKSSKNDNDKKNKKTNDNKVPNSKKAKGTCRALLEAAVTQEWSDTHWKQCPNISEAEEHG
jgi:hypothetical protein